MIAISSGAKQVAQIAAQKVAQQVRDQGMEAIKAGAKQVGVPVNESAPSLGGSPERSQTLANLAGRIENGQLNPAQLEQERQAKLKSMRVRLKQIMDEELQVAAQEKARKLEAWQKAQEEAFKTLAPEQQGSLVEPQGTLKKAVGKFKNAAQRKLGMMQKGGETKAAKGQG